MSRTVTAHEFEPAEVRKVRALLAILRRTCHETLSAIEATGQGLDRHVAADLVAAIERSEQEFRTLAARIAEGTR